MEYLTELKVGTEIPVEVLDRYMRDSYNFSYKSDGQFERGISGISIIPAIRVVTSLYSDRFVVTKSDGAVDLYYKLSGFVEFYNKFYNLTPKTMNRDPKRLEDWHNCVFYHNTKAEGLEIERLLKAIGFKLYSSPNSKGYIRTEKKGSELNLGSYRDSWHGYLNNPTEFEPEEAIAALSGKSTPSTSKRTNFDKCKVWIDSPDTLSKVLSRLKELGYKWQTNNTGVLEFGLYIKSTDIYGWAWDREPAFLRNSYELVTVNDILGTTRINTNNHILTPKTDGKIIVSRKATTVTVGQRPTGRSISGRTSRITITIGHLSNQTIRSGF